MKNVSQKKPEKETGSIVDETQKRKLHIEECLNYLKSAHKNPNFYNKIEFEKQKKQEAKNTIEQKAQSIGNHE